MIFPSAFNIRNHFGELMKGSIGKFHKAKDSFRKQEFFTIVELLGQFNPKKANGTKAFGKEIREIFNQNTAQDEF